MMATVKLSRPPISSPLAAASDSPAHNPRNASTVGQRRPGHFPTSRGLRPFATISHVMQQPKSRTSQDQKRPSVKLIEPPTNQRMTFLLDLTQAELGRQG